jgi:hypothetical protein
VVEVVRMLRLFTIVLPSGSQDLVFLRSASALAPAASAPFWKAVAPPPTRLGDEPTKWPQWVALPSFAGTRLNGGAAPSTPVPTVDAIEHADTYNIDAGLMKPEERLKSYAALISDRYAK